MPLMDLAPLLINKTKSNANPRYCFSLSTGNRAERSIRKPNPFRNSHYSFKAGLVHGKRDDIALYNPKFGFMG